MTARRRDRTKDNGYQKLFIKKLLRYLLHHLLLAITHKVRLRYAEKLLGSIAQKRIVTTKTLRRFSSSEIAEYRETLSFGMALAVGNMVSTAQLMS